MENSGEKAAQLSAALLGLIWKMVLELYPQERPRTIKLGSSLTLDLGFDSLGRVELISRIEDEFGVRLSDETLVKAETPQDLLNALLASGEAKPPVQFQEFKPPEAALISEQPETLLEALDWHLERQPDRIHIRLIEESGVNEISYRKLYEEGQAVAGGLRARGLQAGQTVALMLPTGEDFFYGFLGVLMAGGIPVPLYPPFRLAEIAEHLRRQVGILNNAGAVLLIASPEVARLGPILQPLVASLDAVVTVSDLKSRPTGVVRIHPHDIALLQYTSGSTGQPKGVVLTHSNLVANIRAVGQFAGVQSTDVFVSWMPLYHDLGLIGAWLASFYYGMLAVIMSPVAFLARPERWLWAIHNHHGTISAAPNFAYELCVRQIKEQDLVGLNLSSLRLCVSGAEMVSPDTLNRFTKRFEGYGLKSEALVPAFGLAEATVGLTMTPIGRGPRVDHIQRQAFFREGKAVPQALDPLALRFVSCGRPLPGCTVRIVDSDGNECPERKVGRLEFQGPACTSGYFHNSEATEDLFDDGWLDSGDLAYMAEGELYPTGRSKDIIIRGGQHLFPSELEEKVGGLPGIIKDGVAVFGSREPTLGTERVVVYAETIEHEKVKIEALRTRVTQLSVETLGVPADDVVFGPPHSVPKTASGKIRHSAARELYEQGQLGVHFSVRRQIVGLLVSGLVPRLRRLVRRLGCFFYTVYAWLIFILFAPLIWLMVVLLPTLPLRRQFLKTAGSLILNLLGLSPVVKGGETLQVCSPRIYVANHMSFIDALIMVAILPSNTAFTPGRELERRGLVRIFLRRIGVHFVDRLDPRRSLQDIERINEIIRQGVAVMVFPEGAVYPESGLRPFHMGPFIMAAQTGIPVLPMAILGTRQILTPYSWVLHWGKVVVIVGEAIDPMGADWASAAKLRDSAFRAILTLGSEPEIK